MYFEEALTEVLEGIVPDKVYPVVAPEGTQAPYCVYASSYGKPDRTLDGHLTSREITVTIAIVGTTYTDMKLLMTSTMDTLLALEGQTVGEFIVQSVHIDDQPDEVVDPNNLRFRSFVEITFRV